MSNGNGYDRIIIEGIREDNKKFRPSDWAERISEMLATFGADHKLHYSEFVHPCIIGGEQCLVVDRRLSETHPDAFKFILNFAAQNKLRIQEDRREARKPVEVDRRSRPEDHITLVDVMKELLPVQG